MLADPTEILRRVAAEVLTPRKIMTVEAWADQHRILTATSAEQGRYRTSRTPYMAEPMRCCTDRHVRRIVFCCGSQLSKTETMFNVIGHAACERPRPALYAIATHRLAAEYSQTRLQPAIRASDVWDGHTLEMNVGKITFDRMHLALVGAHNSANLKGRPIGLGLFDEIDEWPAGHLGLARERMKTFADSLEICASTPTDAHVGIDAEYANSDRRTYYTPCPHCETHHKLVWENVRWDRTADGSQPDPDVAAATACMVCPECGCEIHDLNKPQMLRRGVWLPAGERPAGPRDRVMRTAEAYDGTPVPVTGYADRPNSPVRGYQLSSLYSPFTAFGDVVRAFAEAGFKMGPGFCNGQLGEAWKDIEDSIDRSKLDALKIERRHGGYAMRTVPRSRPMLITTVDVQSDRCYLLTLGFGALAGEGAPIAIVDWREIRTPEGGGLSELDQVLLSLRYPLDNGKHLRPLAYGIDIGHRTTEVYDLIRRLRGRLSGRFWPVKGDATPNANQSLRELSCEFYPGTKTQMPPEMRLKGLLINTDMQKTALHGVVKMSLARRREGKPGPLIVPEDVPGAVLDGLVSEQRKRVIKRGVPVLIWEKRAGRLGEFNHPLDLAVYARGIADREKLDRATEQDVEKVVAGAVGVEGAKG